MSLSPMAKNSKRILIAVGDVAAGHRVPAVAIQQAVNTLHPGSYDIEVVGFFQYRDPFPFTGGSAASLAEYRQRPPTQLLLS